MCVVYGHASRGLPWLLQLLTSRGLDIDQVNLHLLINRSTGSSDGTDRYRQIDRKGYSPLHLCAEKNIMRPIRMLVDAGADVNAHHGVSQLTALQVCFSPTYISISIAHG
jgi:hypothetical protein